MATVVSNPYITTYFGEVPTVSHRSHHVGVNTNAFGSEDVLVIENFTGRKNILLKGVDPNDPKITHTITIDLTKGTIDGATITGATISGVTISGGSW